MPRSAGPKIRFEDRHCLAADRVAATWQASAMGRSRSAASSLQGNREKRPFVERVWWLLLISAWAWLRLLNLAFGDGKGDLAFGDASPHTILNAVAVVFLIVAVPVWLWERRRGERKRRASEPSE